MEEVAVGEAVADVDMGVVDMAVRGDKPEVVGVGCMVTSDGVEEEGVEVEVARPVPAEEPDTFGVEAVEAESSWI